MLLDLQRGILQSDRIPWESKDTPGKTIAAGQQLLSMARAAGEFVCSPIEGEEVVHKMAVSAFCGTRVEGLLRNCGTQEVVVAGAFTHMVVETTVRQGFDLGFEMHVAAAACCSPTSALHEASLANGISNFARVLGDIEAATAVLEAGRKVRNVYG